MKKQGFVSLWIGETKSVNDLNDFLKITYNKDGDYVPSSFARGFKTGRYDDDFREAEYYTKPLSKLNELPEGFSFYDIIMPKFERIVENNVNEHFNAVIFLYNFEYDGIQKHYNDDVNSFNYIGTVEYK